ncbi:Pentatricopeptide repeat-containing protein [Nymphaea thermarum]|nr:Pentatricopeptide repeat-containing protein [Nymphaea thermarum]
MAAAVRCPFTSFYLSPHQPQPPVLHCPNSKHKGGTPTSFFGVFPLESFRGLTIPSLMDLPAASAFRQMAKKGRHMLPPVDKWSLEERMKEALEVLDLMRRQGMRPDPSLYCILLKSCADSRNIEVGATIHEEIMRQGLESDVFIANNLIGMYGVCGRLPDARQVFDGMPQRNVVSWTSIISAYCQASRAAESLKLYDEMVAQKIKPNAFTYAAVLKSCAKLQDIEKGREIHQRVIDECCDSDDYIRVALVDMYAKCGRMEEARREFDKIPEPSPVAFTAMIHGYSILENGTPEAIVLIRRMLDSGADEKFVQEVGFFSMIRSCAQVMGLSQGQEIHAHLIKTGYDPGTRARLELVELYLKCRKTTAALSLFNTLHIYEPALHTPAHLWSALIFASVTEGLNRDALTLFSKMLRKNVKPNSSLMCRVVEAVVCLSAIEEGKQVFGLVIKAFYRSLDEPLMAGLINLCNENGVNTVAFET